MNFDDFPYQGINPYILVEEPKSQAQIQQEIEHRLHATKPPAEGRSNAGELTGADLRSLDIQ